MKRLVTPVVLFRGYPDPKTGKFIRAQQGKIITEGPGGQAIYFRNVTNRNRYWGDKSWMIDWMVYEVCRSVGVKELHYLDEVKRVLFFLPMAVIENKVNEFPWQYVTTLGGHTQISLPYDLWNKRVPDYAARYVAAEALANDYVTAESYEKWEELKRRSNDGFWGESNQVEKPKEPERSPAPLPVMVPTLIEIPEQYRAVKSFDELRQVLIKEGALKGGR